MPDATSPLANLRHDHVALRVADFDAAVRWYVDKLDFTVDTQWPFGEMQLAYLSHGSAKIELLAGAGPAPQERYEQLDASFAQERIHHLCLAVDDVDAVVAELARRGVGLIGEPFEVAEIDRRLAFLEDDSGNLIELSGPR